MKMLSGTRNYKKFKRISFAIGIDKTSVILIPTILIMPKLISWLDEEQRWDNSYYTLQINFEWIIGYIKIGIDYKNKEKK